MNPIDRLTELFREFPGIGPRQAKRFVYFLLTRPSAYRSELSSLVQELKNSIAICTDCFKFFIKKGGGALCTICSNQNRNKSLLMIVGNDVDLENIEKSHSYDGFYFALGGLVPVLEINPEKRVRERELIALVEKKIATASLKEIIIALSANVEGDTTAVYLKKILSPIALPAGVTISVLGRGLSTGTELEYSDSDTIKNALQNRTQGNA